MKIGKYTLHPISTGTFALDGGAMFGIIPKPLWERTNPADGKNRILMEARSLLLTDGKENILLDTGIGSYWDAKFEKIYDLHREETALENSLEKLGLKPGDITSVIFTHLHFDHTGGSTIPEGEKWIPAFPNAKYFVQKKHFEWAMNPTEKDRGSFLRERFEPLMREGVLQLLDGRTNFNDEIEIIPVEGHTVAQQALKISDGEKTLFYCGDLFPTSSHIPLPYIMAYDLFPLQTLKEKKEFLPKAVEENWLLFYEHDPYCLASTVKTTEKGFAAGEKFTKLPE